MSGYNGLVFSYKSLIDECEVLKVYASEVLDKKTIGAIDEAKGALQNVRARADSNRSVMWSINENSPLATIATKESNPKGVCVHKARGLCSFVWEIRHLNEGAWKNGKHFLLNGLA